MADLTSDEVYASHQRPTVHTNPTPEPHGDAACGRPVTRTAVIAVPVKLCEDWTSCPRCISRVQSLIDMGAENA